MVNLCYVIKICMNKQKDIVPLLDSNHSLISFLFIYDIITIITIINGNNVMKFVISIIFWNRCKSILLIYCIQLHKFDAFLHNQYHY